MIVTAAGNDRNKPGGTRYPLLRDSRLSSDFSLSASSVIFGSPRLDVFDDPTRFDPDPTFSGFPSLFPSETRRQKLASYLAGVPNTVGPAPNVIIVGATTNAAEPPVFEAPFSDSLPDVRAVGTDVRVIDDESGGKANGTSLSTPQVAGLATYLWLLSDDLQSKPVSVTRRAIMDNALTDLGAPDVFLVDAYASVLSLDQGVAPTPTSAPVRFALLDITGDGVFNEADVDDFATALVGSGNPRSRPGIATT